MLFELKILPNFFCNTSFHFPNFFGGHFLKMRKIEPQRIGRNMRPFLLDMLAQYFAKSFMKKVCSRMITLSCRTFFHINFETKNTCGIARHFIAKMHRQIGFSFRIKNPEHFTVFINKNATIAYLSTHFGIEWRFFENNLIKLPIFLFYLSIT